jgi:hypothetical protein
VVWNPRPDRRYQRSVFSGGNRGRSLNSWAAERRHTSSRTGTSCTVVELFVWVAGASFRLDFGCCWFAMASSEYCNLTVPHLRLSSQFRENLAKSREVFRESLLILFQ